MPVLCAGEHGGIPASCSLGSTACPEESLYDSKGHTGLRERLKTAVAWGQLAHGYRPHQVLPSFSGKAQWLAKNTLYVTARGSLRLSTRQGNTCTSGGVRKEYLTGYSKTVKKTGLSTFTISVNAACPIFGSRLVSPDPRVEQAL